jgi:alcohol dehydrogenase class IV
MGAAPDFTFVDGDRLIRFGEGVRGEAGALLEQRGFSGYALLSTPRARGAAPELAESAQVVADVPEGRVDEVSAAVRGQVGGRPIVALGGGRVIDAAKAIAGADGLACAAVPTTLSGAPFTPFHRMPAGADTGHLVRPSLVVADTGLMASQPMPGLAGSAMNSLAHAVEALYGPLANPVAGMAALRSASAFALALHPESPDRPALAYASFLGGYAVGTTGFAIHHAACQTIVRELGTPHAETNAVMLPRTVAFMADRAPTEISLLAMALGDSGGDPGAAAGLVGSLAALAGPESLSDLGVEEGALPALAQRIAAHPATGNTPPSPPTEDDVLALLRSAL